MPNEVINQVLMHKAEYKGDELCQIEQYSHCEIANLTSATWYLECFLVCLCLLIN